MKAIVFVLLIVLIACAMLSACGEENEPPKVVDISPKPNSDVPSNIIVLDVEFNVPVSLDSSIANCDSHSHRISKRKYREKRIAS